MCAMADVTPQKSPQDAWNENQHLVECLVEETLRRMSDRGGFKKHYWLVLEEAKNTFLSSYHEASWLPDRVDDMVIRGTPDSEAFWRNIWIPDLVDGVVEGFVMEERKRLWDAHKAIVLSKLQEALPAAARPFETYYTEFFLPKFVFRKFDAGFPEGRWADELEEWLEQLVKEVVATEIPKLVNDTGELLDEQLVHMATSHVDEARVQLMERYSPRIKKIVRGIVYAHNVCPPSHDVTIFIEEVSQNVCVKILANLDSYGFKAPFKHWVATICTNEAYTLQEQILGRADAGPRHFVSWEELLEQPPAPVIRDPALREALLKILEEHAKRGTRARKSSQAIYLSYFNELEAKQVAERLGTTSGYVNHLISHDYPIVRKMFVDKYRVWGSDL
jgi:RNA polymerase sigma factor (sigma-70 family)